MRQERNLYFQASELLAPAWRTAVQPYFSKTFLDTVRTVVLKGARIPPPFLFRSHSLELRPFS
jgi:hypothetical protein